MFRYYYENNPIGFVVLVACSVFVVWLAGTIINSWT